MVKKTTLYNSDNEKLYPRTSAECVGYGDGTVKDALDNTGVGDYPTFSESTAYSAGDVVNYNGKLYKFTADHAAGAWTGNDVEEDITLLGIVNYSIWGDIINCGSFSFDRNYAPAQKLVTYIPKYSIVSIKGDFTSVTAYEQKDGNHIQLKDGDTTSIDIRYIRNLEIVGHVSVSFSRRKPFMLPDTYIGILSPATNNIFPQLTYNNLSNLDSSTLLYCPYLILRDKTFDSLYLSQRPLGFNIHVLFYDADGILISRQLIRPSSPSLSIPENCEYIGFSDYAVEARTGGTMVNYGEEKMPYEPFSIIRNDLYNISGFKTSFHWDEETSTLLKELPQNIQKGSQIVIYGDDNKATLYNYDNTTFSVNNGDYITEEVKRIRNIKSGTIKVEVAPLSLQNHLSAKCVSPCGKNIYCQNLIEGEDSEIKYVSTIKRDFEEKKITISTRQHGYYLRLCFLDVFGEKISQVHIEADSDSVSKTADIPDNCAYIEFWDFPPETRTGGTMVNYGEEQIPYEPFTTNETRFANNKILAFEDKSTINSIATEPIILVANKESNIYLEDILAANKTQKDKCRKTITNTHYQCVANIGFATPTSTGSKTGTFYATSRDNVFRFPITTTCINVPAGRTINMLDIGSSYIDMQYISKKQKLNYEADGMTVNMLGTMGVEGSRHEARSGGTWDFVVKPLGRAVIVDVNNVTSLPITAYPGTTYADENGIKWTVRGVVINGGSGKLVLGPFSIDPNFDPSIGAGSESNDYDSYAENMPESGVLTKTTNDTVGTETDEGDQTVNYTAKELVCYNPFWDPSTNKLSFSYYVNKWGFNPPDMVSFTFGSNDLGNFSLREEADVDAVVAKAKTAIDQLHSDYPNCKVLITSSCYGYSGYSYSEYITPIREWNLQSYYRKLVAMFGKETEYSAFVRVVPTLFMVDRKNGFTVWDKQPCSLYSEKIKINGDAIHLGETGYYQFANSMLGYAYDLFSVE